jgi:hypothetical protein
MWRWLTEDFLPAAVLPIAIPIAANSAIAWHFGADGFAHWYLVAATGSSLVFALAGLFTKADEHVDLISPSFLSFHYSIEMMFMPLHFGWDPPVAWAPKPPVRAPFRWLEWWVARLISFVVLWLLIAWHWIVAPLVYPLYLVLGAPARVAARSEGVTYRHGESWILDPRRGELPAGAQEFTIAARPVTFTALLTTAVLWVAAQVVQAL